MGACRVKCVCGGNSSQLGDPLDGLPTSPDPLQTRLHQIILRQKKVVEELSGQLRDAREALRRAAAPSAPPQAHAHAHATRTPTRACSSVSSTSTSVSGGASSGSSSEVEAGEEARAWLPDRAAPRCLHCCERFWLARRRHHCRRCGGIFCGSCSTISVESGGVRLCHACRSKR